MGLEGRGRDGTGGEGKGWDWRGEGRGGEGRGKEKRGGKGGLRKSPPPKNPRSATASLRRRLYVLCFRDISSTSWWIITKFLSLVHLGTKMNSLKVHVTFTRCRRPALDPAVQ